ncbi:PREDICTED: uncharacterized protein LOC105144003 [Acromyrmex echinatior]|uniref:uncharacterized protein LOC105144003 n=1 Tax=Acromyrmex echinatior TaxID=103372 RepID=UPI000580DA91|nr:PREDICTED: uncharacterized protein LOC105144003 [Acromyrmex echinatior]
MIPESCDTRLYERLKNVLHQREQCIETKKDCSNIMEHRAVRLLNRRYDLMTTGTSIYEIYILESMLIHRITWRSLWEIADTNCLSKRVRASTSNDGIYKMLRNEYKDNFINVGPLIVRVCTLNDVAHISMSRFFIRMHDDDRNAMPYVSI